MKRNAVLLSLLVLLVSALSVACSPKFYLFPDYSDPLHEVTLSGEGEQKVLVVPISGVIDSQPDRGFLRTEPSVVQEVVAALEIARKDDKVKAVILQIDSPGGTATGSDILYREIRRFKEDTGKKVVALMMSMATSGGYYAAMSSDWIVAHPTTVTGSIGVIFYTFTVDGLFGKIGVTTEPIKSGAHKDIASPFRPMNDEERKILQSMIDEMYGSFVSAVDYGRKDLDMDAVKKIADGRVYTARQALGLKLIDQIGYTYDAVAKAKELAGLDDKARVVTYRRNQPANDNIYNTSMAQGGGGGPLVDLGLSRFVFAPRAGFYYIWEPGTVH
jgi:protease-4